MTASRRLALSLASLVAITAIGTLGFAFVAGFSWIDALYMTVITISTVGYGEVGPLGPGGKLFTIGLIVTAVGTAFYLFTTVAELLLEGRLRDLFQRTAMQRTIDKLERHVIVCGYGRFGRFVVEDLVRNPTPVVVVDSDPTLEAELVAASLPYVIGSAASEDVLDRAGVDRALAIVVGTSSDAENVFITLSARERNPSLRIHARGESETGARRLQMAGAHQVVSAYQLGGARVAASILRPAVVDFLEIARPRFGEEVDLEEIRVAPGSGIEGQRVAELELQAPRVRIVALKRGDERIQIVPEPETQIQPGDHLVVIGGRASLEKLAQMASAG